MSFFAQHRAEYAPLLPSGILDVRTLFYLLSGRTTNLLGSESKTIICLPLPSPCFREA